MPDKLDKATFRRDFLAYDAGGRLRAKERTAMWAMRDAAWLATEDATYLPVEVRRVTEVTWRSWRISRTVVVWTATNRWRG